MVKSKFVRWLAGIATALLVGVVVGVVVLVVEYRVFVPNQDSKGNLSPVEMQKTDNSRTQPLNQKLIPHFPDPPPIATRVGVEFVIVPGGTFEMGDLFGDGNDDEKPTCTVTVLDFRMSKYEITNIQYCVFLNEIGNQEEIDIPWLDLESENCLIEKRKSRFTPKTGFENHPVVEVNWFGAKSFAEWIGCRLPTEAEWEYAARVGGQNIKYPWGNEFEQSMVNCNSNNVKQVGSYPPNQLGLYDMAGNAWEWCSDWYRNDYFTMSTGYNPTGPINGKYRIYRGGSFRDPAHYVRCSKRLGALPGYRKDNFGFRVVISQPQK